MRYNNIGSAYGKKGEYRKAIKYIQTAIPTLLNFLPVNHPNIKTIMSNIELIKIEQKRNNKS